MRILTRPIRWLIALLLLPVKIILAPIVNLVRLIYSIAVLAILVILIGMALGYIPIPDVSAYIAF